MKYQCPQVAAEPTLEKLMRPLTAAGSIGVTLIVMSIAACSSGSKSPASTTASASVATTGGGTAAPASLAPPTATTTTATAPTTTAASTAKATIDACSLLTVAKASSLTGNTYTAATPKTLATGQDSCSYARGDGSPLVIIVYQPDSGVTFDMMSAVSDGATVSGVGDKAMIGDIELDVQAGKHLIAVQGAGGTITGKYTAAEAVAKAVIAAL